MPKEKKDELGQNFECPSSCHLACETGYQNILL